MNHSKTQAQHDPFEAVRIHQRMSIEQWHELDATARFFFVTDYYIGPNYAAHIITWATQCGLRIEEVETWQPSKSPASITD